MQLSGTELDRSGRSRRVRRATRSPGVKSMMREPPRTEGLRIAVKALGATSTIGLEGEWDLAGESAASRAIAKTLDRSPERLVLDLSRLAFMDCTGVQAAIQLSARSHAENFQLAIVPGPRAVQRVFDICHVTEALPFVASA
jgi:anti-anti-sigma factor